MSERYLHPDLQDFLLANEPYTYFHLVSIERPGYDKYSPVYSYVTDSSINIVYGGATYIANKVLSRDLIVENILGSALKYWLCLLLD